MAASPRGLPTPATLRGESMTPQMRADWTEGPYLLMFRHSGKCLADPAGSLLNGKEMIQWECAAIDDQRWYVDWDADGTSFRLRNKKSGKCLNVRDAQTANGTQIQQWTCQERPESHWDYLGWIYGPGDPYRYIYTILDRNTARCVHQHGAVTTNNGRITLWQCSAGSYNTHIYPFVA